MPYTAEHKQETRTRIIKSARRLFNRNGFAEVTIDQIMDDAGNAGELASKSFDEIVRLSCCRPERQNDEAAVWVAHARKARRRGR